MRRLLALGAHLARRLLRNWPYKLASLLTAFLFWFLVTSASTTITQRSFAIPLEVDGVEGQELAVGVPNVVEVSVSGPGPRVDRLRPDQLRATLDLTGARGDFERPIVVQTPSEIKLLGVNPSDVIGFLETAAQKSATVDVAVVGEAPEGEVITAISTPRQVIMTGRTQLLDQVARVVALTGAEGGEAALVAMDNDDQPIASITFQPLTVTVAIVTRPVLYTTTVEIDFTPPSAYGLGEVSLVDARATVAGPPDQLGDLTNVPGTVEPLTGDVAPGRYTLPVRLDLPPGVVAVSTPSAVLQYLREPLEP